jgi:hypothetical protein
MNPYKQIARSFIVAAVIMLLNNHCQAQVLVNDKNLNEDKDLHYIQLMYYIEKSNLRPVYFLDYGYIEPEYNDILEPEQIYNYPKITINGAELNDRVSPAGVLNKLHKAGWEYMGDVVYIPLGTMKNWHVFTMRRK